MNMMHCGTLRKILLQDTYVLNSFIDQYKYQLLGITLCPDCKQIIMSWQGIVQDENDVGEQFSVKRRDHPKWLERIDPRNSNYSVIHRGEFGAYKQTRGQTFASEFSRLISRNTESTWERVLQRLLG